MNRFKTKIRPVVFLLLLPLLFFSACNGSHELYDLGIVLGIGLDKSDAAGQVDMTLQLASGIQGDPGGGMGGLGSENSDQYINYSLRGDASISHFREFTLSLQKEIYLAHNELLVLGEPLAREGIHTCLDFYLREQALRLSTNMLVAKGRAAELLSAGAMLSEFPTLSLAQREDNYAQNGQTRRCTIFDFVSAMVSDSSCATVPMAELQEIADGKQISVFNGLAIFRKDTMIGILEQEDILGLLFLTNELTNDTLRFSVRENIFDAELQRNQTRLSYSVREDGSADILVTVRAGGRLASQEGNLQIGDAENWEAIIRAGAAQIETEMLATLRSAQALHADIFGFGEAIAKCEPAWWAAHKSTWEENLPKLRFAFDIELDLDTTGLASETIR